MTSTIREPLGKAAGGVDLSAEEMVAAIDLVMEGAVPDEQIGLLLTALHTKGETPQEIAGAARSLRRHMRPIRSSRTGLIDTCGTGGDGSQTFNISTAAAIVTAAAGVPVAKHGNRGMSSRSGSADALAALGVNIAADVPVVEACLDELGICFCYAQLFHPAMKRVSAVRKQLGTPTIFNLLGPLSNPAGAEFQVLGIGKPHLRGTMAEALRLLAPHRALVVCGNERLDEVTIDGPTDATEIIDGGSAGQEALSVTLTEHRWTPENFGLATSSLDSVKVTGPAESVAIIQRVLAGERGAARDIVVANSAAALWTAGKFGKLDEAAAAAAMAIDSGAARRLLNALVARTNE